MSEGEKRLGWSEPVTIDPERAADLRVLAREAFATLDSRRRSIWPPFFELTTYPLEYDGGEADAVRDVLTITGPKTNTPEHDSWMRLKLVFIPQPDVCEPNRQDIKEAAEWIRAAEDGPEEDETTEAELAVITDSMVEQAQAAFESKPEGCELIMTADGTQFDCERCTLSYSTSPQY